MPRPENHRDRAERNRTDRERRSAAMAAMSSEGESGVLQAFDQLLRERGQDRRRTCDLPASWTNVREVPTDMLTNQ